MKADPRRVQAVETNRRHEQPARGVEGDCDSPACRCGAGVDRRTFLKLSGILTGAIAASGLPVAAGPFANDDFEKLVPADKKLDPEWVKSLFARGGPEVWRGTELAHIGMPVGGLCAGQLYLGGDGKLWHWDIFNLPQPENFRSGGGPNYANPVKPSSPLEQGFAIAIGSGNERKIRPLEREGFRDITFRGEYPIAFVNYADPDCPITVSLEAFSPFIPLNVADSSLPATVMQFTVKNSGKARVEGEIAGWLENAVCLESGRLAKGQRRNRVFREKGYSMVASTAEAPTEPKAAARPDISFDDFEHELYGRWVATGTAFGKGPVEMAQMPAYQGAVGGQGKRIVNTHNARQGEDVTGADAHTGRLLSEPFTIERDYVTFLVGGGAHAGRTCVNLQVDGKMVCTVTGKNDNRMSPHSFDVRAWAGRTARIEVVDAESGAWGNISIDDIVFSDHRRGAPEQLEAQADFGSMALAILGGSRKDFVQPAVASGPASALLSANSSRATTAVEGFGGKLIGAVGRRFSLKPGESTQVSFLVAWHFPGLLPEVFRELLGAPQLRRSYAMRFESAAAVARYLARDFERLAGETKLWNRTWYDSSLPHWFLDRTFIPVCCLATSGCFQFDNGRFYAFEGTYCCQGTCQHVWQYAQSVARLFPELERSVREQVDFGLAWHESGAMDYRGEYGRQVAHDGFAGTILRVYREHTMSRDAAFLRRLWPRVKQSIAFLMAEDKDQDGLLEGEQYNTLDASWFGPMGWISSLYLAALAAGSRMARKMGDAEFAERCDKLVRAGRENLVRQLFNGEYFIHKPDPRHASAINTNIGCHIDQVFGQSYAWQLGLGRVVPQPETISALESLWKYSFTPDVGPYRSRFKTIPGGRWYALSGEGGLLMCTFPKGGAEKSFGGKEPGFAGYFNECMSGFEYQVAAHMIWEGKVLEGLAITRSIHDRYAAAKRNPYNEVECADHYSRAMMSHGVYLAACGFEYHGPTGQLGFAPRLTPENFRCAFTAAEGWGTFSQSAQEGIERICIELKWGRLMLRNLKLACPTSLNPGRITARVGQKTIAANLSLQGSEAQIKFTDELLLAAGETLELTLG